MKMISPDAQHRVLQILRHPITICVLIATIYLGAYLLFPGFNVIDDGWNLQVMHNLQNTPLTEWGSILVESDIGRFRPIYYLYFYTIFSLVGVQPFLYWFGQWATLAATLYVMNRLLYRTTKNIGISWVGTVVPLIFPAIPENLYRLGTQEPRQFLLELLFMYWAVELEDTNLSWQRLSIGPMLLILALGSKETSLILIPIFLGIFGLKWLQGGWRSSKLLVVTGLMIAISYGFYSLIPTSQNYSTGYQLSFPNMLKTALFVRISHLHLFWLLGMSICFMMVRVFVFEPSLDIKKLISRHFWQFCFLGATLASFVIILPWNLQLERYYYNVTLFMLMFVFAEIAAWWKLRPLIERQTAPQRILLVMMLLIAYVGMNRLLFRKQLPRYGAMVRSTHWSMTTWFSGYQNNHLTIRYLMEHTRENEAFYGAFGDYEVVYDMGLYASLFGKRPIKVYSENEQLTKDKGYPHYLVEDSYAAFEADSGPKILVDKASDPSLETISTGYQVMMPKVTLYRRPMDVWAVAQSPN